jgi:hypothetical protein
MRVMNRNTLLFFCELWALVRRRAPKANTLPIGDRLIASSLGYFYASEYPRQLEHGVDSA